MHIFLSAVNNIIKWLKEYGRRSVFTGKRKQEAGDLQSLRQLCINNLY